MEHQEAKDRRRNPSHQPLFLHLLIQEKALLQHQAILFGSSGVREENYGKSKNQIIQTTKENDGLVEK
jgi:hypothetical protein